MKPLLYDSHAHFDSYDNLDSVIKQCNEQLAYMIAISITHDHWEFIHNLTERYETIYGALGIHPNHVQHYSTFPETALVEQVKRNKKIVAIGECGLDYYHFDGLSPETIQGLIQQQQSFFATQLKLASQLNLPISLHTRNAESDTMKIIDDHLAQGHALNLVCHCFSSSQAFADYAIAKGFYISFSGIITFKNAEYLRHLASLLPLDRLLIETDSPYLAPQPFRGKTNYPFHVKEVAKTLAEVKGMSVESMQTTLLNNSLSVFKRIQLSR